MRCPTCTTEVPPARFCARCGDRLADGPATDPATRRFMRADAQEASSSGWARTVAAVTAALLAVVGASAVAGWMTPDAGLEDREVGLPTATPERPSAEADPAPAAGTTVTPPSATVMCSNFSEHRVELARLDGAEVGAVVEVHGGPCVVTDVDAETASRDYPRGVARGNRPGVGPGR